MKLVITDIKRGDGNRSELLYGVLRDAETGELMISATLDYIVDALKDRLPRKDKKP
jgi:hypothetical protein